MTDRRVMTDDDGLAGMGVDGSSFSLRIKRLRQTL